MSYGTKYTLEFPDYYNRACQILIEEESYAGASTDIKGADMPFVLSPETPSDFILDPINGTSATLRLMSETDFQFLDLYTNSNRKYRITFNIDTVLQWRGFLQPDQYQEDYTQTPYATEFVAVDQLGFLKTIAWDRTVVESEMTVLGRILEKTDLELDLYEGVNVYEDSHNSTTADSPLAQTYINSDVFLGLTYYDALKAILFKYAAIIKQDRGKWVIYRPEDAIAAYQRRLWTYSSGVFTYSSTASHDPVVDTTSATAADLVRITPGMMFINPAWGKYTLIQNYGRRDSIFDNPDFTQWNSPTDPKDWLKIGTTVERYGDKMRLSRVTAFDSNRHVSQYKNTINAPLESFHVKFSYDVFCPSGSDCTFYLAFKAHTTTGYDYWYNFDTGGLSASFKAYEKLHDASAGTVRETNTVDVIAFTAGIFAGTITAYIYCFKSASATAYVDVDEVNISILLAESAGLTEPIENNEQEIIINPDNNFDGGEQEMLISDIPDRDSHIVPTTIANGKLIYYGGMWLDSAQLNPTGKWTGSGITGRLATLLQNSISKFVESPQQIISVPIVSKLLFPSSVIKEVNNANRLFMIRRASWDVLNGIWDAEAHEIGIGAGLALKAEDGTDLLAEDGQTLIA